MRPVALGIALPLEEPVASLLATVEEAEALGCDFVWVNDDRLQKDPFSCLAAIALRTERVQLGTGVTNPYSRHPALLATAVATLDELSEGRAVLGLGAGGTNHRALGVTRTAPVRTMREAIGLVRGLLRGEVVSVEGPALVAHEAVLDFEPLRADIPIYLGARGPRMLELAGELADGAIVGNVATVEGWRYARARVRAGAMRAGRDPDQVQLVAWLYCSIADDAAAAEDAVRPMVATSLVTSRPILADLGLTYPARFAETMERLGWRLSAEAVRAAGEVLPAEALSWFSLAGTPEGCRHRLARLLAEFPEIGQVAIVPAAAEGGSTRDVVRRFLTEVAPGVAAAGAEIRSGA
ncbi:MAG TPA: LLM class flavin-dependent oxidoreductase [Gaiellaceae bacterium]|nr:LLM class flavin-dependent oxidoreductase [Gaiellaceae bacterium]